jgi:thiosulfate reductase cytochrome b subunit
VTFSGTLTTFRQSRWFALVWILPVAIIGLALIVLAARGVRATDWGVSFLAQFPGESHRALSTPTGFPAWLAWQHGLNAFFILFIIRSGWQVRTVKRPAAHWTRNNKGVFRTKGSPTRISLDLWMHISLDTLWVVNGILFYVLIFSTGQWLRIVPTRWDIFPNAVSSALQYASLNWPVENGWSNYNALQVLSYFVVVFIAAPLAVITGIRMAPGFSSRFKPLDRVFPMPVARKIHYPVMLFFVVFIVVHVTLVLTTGALNNLNHMYATRNDQSWVGFWVFASTIVLMAAAWVASKPLVLRTIASLSGTISR